MRNPSGDTLQFTYVDGPNLEQDTAELLISGPDDQEGAELSPDGRWILYWSTARGGDSRPRLMRFPLLGGSPEQVLEARISNAAVFDCPVRPTSSCVFSHREQGQLVFYVFDPVRGRGKEHISLAMLDPMALLTLKQTGECYPSSRTE